MPQYDVNRFMYVNSPRTSSTGHRGQSKPLSSVLAFAHDSRDVVSISSLQISITGGNLTSAISGGRVALTEDTRHVLRFWKFTRMSSGIYPNLRLPRNRDQAIEKNRGKNVSFYFCTFVHSLHPVALLPCVVAGAVKRVRSTVLFKCPDDRIMGNPAGVQRRKGTEHAQHGRLGRC